MLRQPRPIKVCSPKGCRVCIDDVRLAAAGILVAFANMAGALSRKEIAAVAEECRTALDTDTGEAERITA